MARDWSQEFLDDAAADRCHKCHGPLVFQNDKNRGAHYFEQECVDFLRKELAEWRSGKRHILRRVYWGDKYVSHIDFTRRKNAHGYARMLREDYGVSAKVARVTVGPAKPKEAK